MTCLAVFVTLPQIMDCFFGCVHIITYQLTTTREELPCVNSNDTGFEYCSVP